MQIELKRRIYTVSELTFFIRDVLEGEFPLIWVKGEVSNLSRPSSGHIYFTLKDMRAVLSAVWFRSNHGLGKNISPEDLEDGKQVICAGKISAYPQRGVYQIIVEFIEDSGIGDLYIELELLKNKLREKGYFDETRKKDIPKNPTKVGVITAKTGAAIEDFLRIAREKGMDHTIRIYPSLVQGIDAPDEIANMIEVANKESWAQVLVIIRGGGSFEDLHVFNSERVADSIYHSKIPIVTGIGHEIDYTIADMVADARCATPTHAANFLWEDRYIYIQQIDELSFSLKEKIMRKIKSKQEAIYLGLKELEANSPIRKLQRIEDTILKLSRELYLLLKRQLELKDRKVEQQTHNLLSVFKQKLLKEQTSLGVELKNLFNSIQGKIHKTFSLVELITIKMESLNPKIQLQRGYTYVKLDSGDIVRSAEELKSGDVVDIVFYDGKKTAVIS